MNTSETDVIVLNVCSVLISELVNNEMLVPCCTDEVAGYANEGLEFLPRTVVHQRLLSILLVELLSGLNEKTIILNKVPEDQKDIGYLYYLKSVPYNDLLYEGGYKEMQKGLDDFLHWLEGECVARKVWLPSIDAELDLHIQRKQYIKICGDVSKHGIIRLNNRIKKLVEVLQNNSVKISEEQAYLVLPEFYEWFYKDVFNYHINIIAEFLNNISWAIYEYVRPIRQRCRLIDEISDPVAKSMYYDLKNFKPSLPKFKITNNLKVRY